MVTFESGLAASEIQQYQIAVLYKKIVEQFTAQLKAFDPVSSHTLHVDFTGKTYIYTLCDSFIKEFKKSIEEQDKKKAWKCFLNMKSKLVNHWIPRFFIQSV